MIDRHRQNLTIPLVSVHCIELKGLDLGYPGKIRRAKINR